MIRAAGTVQTVFNYFVAVVFVFIIFVYVFPVNDRSLEKEIDTRLLDNILQASYKPKYNGKSIFFIESNKKDDKIISLTSRQACCVEAAALSNPTSDIFVLFSYPVGYYNKTRLPFIDILLSYKNVHIAYFNLFEYAENSPLEEWIRTDTLFNSKYYIQHLSDVLRFLTLWKYTGTYLDLDVIIKQNTSSVGSNFACIQSSGIINSAIMNLDQYGRIIAEKYFEELMAHFDGNAFTANGPDMMSKIVEKMCDISDSRGMDRDNCGGFEILPTSACYAIEYYNYYKFFEEKYLNEVMAATKGSFAIHFWNFVSSWKILPTHSNAALINIAEQNCPRTLSVCDEFF